MRKLWNIKKYDARQGAALASAAGVSHLLAGIMINRGIDTAEKAQVFLHPEKSPYHDPYLLPDMAKAVKRIRQAIANHEQIAVYGDYDADGITATTIMLKNLQELGAWADYYIPDRFTEGYGVNLAALEQLYSQGISLVITVDCGIKSLEEIKAMEGRMDIIVTDHHLPGDELPEAVAVVDAHRQDSVYPCPELAGVGIAFKLCQALWQEIKGVENRDQWLEIVALGTVADAVPLVGENRKIVSQGLKRMPRTSCIGLQALMDITGLTGKNVDSTAVGFVLGPRINVAGRLKSARLSVELLLAEKKELAEEIAGQLNSLNDTRKELKNQIQEMAEEQLAAMDMDNAKVIVVAGEDWHHGVLGLVASALQEKYYLPTVVISMKDGIGKGSCRSIPGYNLFEALTNSQEHLVQFGGHAMAAGLTVKAEEIDNLRQALTQEARRQMHARDFIPGYNIDMEISPAEMTMEMVEELGMLEPCGMANESPIFACRGLRGANAELKGTDARHLKFSVADGGRLVDAIGFNMPEMLPRVSRGAFDMVYSAGINEWRDIRKLQCTVKSLDMPVPEIRSVTINRDFLKNVYGFLLSMQRQGKKISSDSNWIAMEATLQGYCATEENMADALQVFKELGFLQETGPDYMELNTKAGRMELANSPTYCRLNGGK